MSWSRVARTWHVSDAFVGDLVRAGALETHEHGERTTITRESVAECQWRIAVAKADMEEESA
jgi:hypothetical protein